MWHISGLMIRHTNVGHLIEADPIAAGGQLAKSVGYVQPDTQSRRPAHGSMRISTPSLRMT